MAREGVSRLEFGDDWSFGLDGRFTNRYGGHHAPVLRSSVSSMGEIFRGANKHINPFYKGKTGLKKDANSWTPGRVAGMTRAASYAAHSASGS